VVGIRISQGTVTHDCGATLATPCFLIPEWYHNDMAFTVRTDEQMEEALTALAAAEGASRQEIIRRAVIERYERSGHAARVAGATEKMQSRWGDVLERLSKT